MFDKPTFYTYNSLHKIEKRLKICYNYYIG